MAAGSAAAPAPAGSRNEGRPAERRVAARLHRVCVETETEAGDVALSASGSLPLFDGFLRTFREGRDEDA